MVNSVNSYSSPGSFNKEDGIEPNKGEKEVVKYCLFRTTESCVTNRLYIGMNQDESMMKSTIFAGDKERTGLGMTEYGSILGRILAIIGVAFKAKDGLGNNIYINKRSFCHLIYRTNYNYKKYVNHFNPQKVDDLYEPNHSFSMDRNIDSICRIFDRT